jgi:large subunit ribosomal protein L4
MQVDVINAKNEKVDSIELPDNVFGVEVSEAVLWEEVKAQRASSRRGTHSTKTRDEVSGSGAKPFKQKGTGRARQGSNRAPNLVGGGVVFGPHPRDYGYRLPRSARRAALRSALSLRAREKALYVVDQLDKETPKTQEIAGFLKQLGHKSVLLVDENNDVLRLSTRNLQKAKYLHAEGVNVLDVLKHEVLVLTKAAISSVVEKAENKSKKAQADASGDEA